MLRELIGSGRAKENPTGELTAANVTIPLGVEHGWEASVLDHYRAAARTIGMKARAGFVGGSASNRVGGSTFTFTVYRGHPHEESVDSLLSSVRAMAQPLWEQVAAYNDRHPPDGKDSRRVTFYAGQCEEVQDDG